MGAGVAQGQVHQSGLGELGRPSEAPPLGIEPGGQPGRGLVEEPVPPGGGRSRDVQHRGPGGGRDDRAGADGVGQLVGLFLHFVATLLPHVVQRGEDGAERWRPAPVAGGKYVPPKKGRRSGVKNMLMGHPPEPVMDWTASM